MDNKKLNNMKDVEEYIKENNELKLCVDKLEELRKAKYEIIKLLNSKNPPEDIFDRMEQNLQDYENLLEKTEELKERIKAQFDRDNSRGMNR